MTTKQAMIDIFQDLPADKELNSGDIQTVIERLSVIQKIQKGIEQVNAGETLTHEEVGLRFHKWLADD